MPKKRVPQNIRSKRTKRSFSEQFYPARTQTMLNKAKAWAKLELDASPRLGLANGRNYAYVQWLKKNSMLKHAKEQARAYAGTGSLWQNPYAKPRPRKAIEMASVWFTAYPTSTITPAGRSIIETLADTRLWDAFGEIGIQGMHTGPMKQAGGISKWALTPSIDGHFDRISMRIDPMFGSEADYVALSATARAHNAIIIDDIVPAHTGKGADFRLAEMKYHDYTGIYHMIEIDEKDWHLLPDVPKAKDSVNISESCEAALKKAGYIVGKLQRVMFYEPGVKETNWSVTKPVTGTDSIKRRWVYLHYFKEGQPSINWLDPTCAGMQLVIGDGLHSLKELGATGLRLDANGFLGIEAGGEGRPAWSQGHPLSVTANEIIAGMVRKVGGFTFQELNLSVDDIKEMSVGGADLSYDFVNRPAYHHALLTGDTSFLQLMLQTALDLGVDAASLVHALQNHDEMTYELVHFWTVHADDTFTFRGQSMSGTQLRDIIRTELKERSTGQHAPYNLPFTENGIACTTATVAAAALGIRSIENLDPTDVERIKRAHLLLAYFNAMQPGVFALSGWDITGALTLDPDSVRDLLHDGDTRWINRGAYDLTGAHPEATESEMGMPKAQMLYGPVTKQLDDDQSFARQLQALLKHRSDLDIARGRQIGIAKTDNTSILGMLHRLPDERLQVSIMNFSEKTVETSLHSPHFTPGWKVVDSLSGEEIGTCDRDRMFDVRLDGFEGLSVIIS